MHGNGHVRFLGGGAAAMSPCYPIAADAVVEERRPPAPADPNPHPRRHAARPVHLLVSGHARQRWSASTPRCRSLSSPHGFWCSLERPRVPGRAARAPEQGGVAADLTDDLMAEAQGSADQRAAHVPGVEQQARGRRPRGAAPWRCDLAGVAGTSAQAGDQRHRTRSIPGRHHGGQRDEALAQQERRPVGLPRGRSGPRHRAMSRTARRQRVDDNGKAPPLPISRRTIRHKADIRPSSRNRPCSSIQW